MLADLGAALTCCRLSSSRGQSAPFWPIGYPKTMGGGPWAGANRRLLRTGLSRARVARTDSVRPAHHEFHASRGDCRGGPSSPASPFHAPRALACWPVSCVGGPGLSAAPRSDCESLRTVTSAKEVVKVMIFLHKPPALGGHDRRRPCPTP
jgi:hypothetical protein